MSSDSPSVDRPFLVDELPDGSDEVGRRLAHLLRGVPVPFRDGAVL